MSATSASFTANLPKSSRRAKRRATLKDVTGPSSLEAHGTQKSQTKMLPQAADLKTEVPAANGNSSKTAQIAMTQTEVDSSQEQERQTDYDNRLTHKIWECATANANPAVDLLVCLERHQPIGFRYVDITRNVVIHHGSRDTRVPVDNVRWLGQTMRRCEVRVLEGEGHGLMASATVMGNVLMEIAKEWEDWMIVVQGRRRGTIGPRPGIPIQA